MNLELMLAKYNYEMSFINMELARCTDAYRLKTLMDNIIIIAKSYLDEATEMIQELEELDND